MLPISRATVDDSICRHAAAAAAAAAADNSRVNNIATPAAAANTHSDACPLRDYYMIQLI